MKIENQDKTAKQLNFWFQEVVVQNDSKYMKSKTTSTIADPFTTIFDTIYYYSYHFYYYYYYGRP